jgi:hypothetical protein
VQRAHDAPPRWLVLAPVRGRLGRPRPCALREPAWLSAQLRARAWLQVCAQLLHGLGHQRMPRRRVGLNGRVLVLAVDVCVQFVEVNEAGVRDKCVRALS